MKLHKTFIKMSLEYERQLNLSTLTGHRQVRKIREKSGKFEFASLLKDGFLAILHPFEQYFIHIRRTGGDNDNSLMEWNPIYEWTGKISIRGS